MIVIAAVSESVNCVVIVIVLVLRAAATVILRAVRREHEIIVYNTRTFKMA
jgi:hypothetical protein